MLAAYAIEESAAVETTTADREKGEEKVKEKSGNEHRR